MPTPRRPAKSRQVTDAAKRPPARQSVVAVGTQAFADRCGAARRRSGWIAAVATLVSAATLSPCGNDSMSPWLAKRRLGLK